jgi:hypothetical protein
VHETLAAQPLASMPQIALSLEVDHHPHFSLLIAPGSKIDVKRAWLVAGGGCRPDCGEGFGAFLTRKSILRALEDTEVQLSRARSLGHQLGLFTPPFLIDSAE